MSEDLERFLFVSPWYMDHNQELIAKGGGLLVIPENHVPEFKRLLVAYYEDRDDGSILTFMREKCWKNF